MNKFKLVALSVLGGILSGFAWTSWCTGLILLISFIPFFLIENYLFENQKRYSRNAYFTYLLPGFVIFSIIAAGWLRVASMAGAVMIILELSFLMSFTLWLAHIVRLKAGNVPGFISLFAFWTGYELLSLKINVLTPWLNPGNGLAKDITFIQWYEVTGTGGGSIWILLSNLLLTIFIINSMKKKRSRIYLLIWFLVIIIPSALSISRYFSIKPAKAVSEEVVIVQPDIDPYTEKFKIPFELQQSKVISLAERASTSDTKWIITPETTIDDPADLENLNANRYVIRFRHLATEYPSSSVVTGMVTFVKYPPSDVAPSASAVLKDKSGSYFDHFNSALKIDSGKQIEVYHKSKLVPGIEMQFAWNPLRLLAGLFPDLGGTSWGYGIRNNRRCFTNNVTKTRIAPIICYESIYGEYIAKYVADGANALFIITNDGWWKNTIGYKQHLWFASLRAIETRRMVARSANTGISCIVDIRGKRIKETGWWEEAVLKGEIIPETTITPYVKYGDYLLRLGVISAIFILLGVFVGVPLRNKLKWAK